MPSTTERFALPYPLTSEPPDGPAQFGSLATAVDAALARAGAQAKATLVPGEQSRSEASFETLGTPDKVEGIVLPAKGFIIVQFEALWKESIASQAIARLFLNGFALQSWVSGASAEAFNEAKTDGANAGKFRPLATAGGVGLYGATPSAATDFAVPNTNAHLLAPTPVGGALGGGQVAISAAAGTYTVSVKYSAASGTLTVKNRRLYVWTQEFA